MNPFEKIIADLKEKEAAGQRISREPLIDLDPYVDGVFPEPIGTGEKEFDVLFGGVIALTEEERRASFLGIVTKGGKRFWRGIQMLSGNEPYLSKEKE